MKQHTQHGLHCWMIWLGEVYVKKLNEVLRGPEQDKRSWDVWKVDHWPVEVGCKPTCHLQNARSRQESMGELHLIVHSQKKML